MSIDTDDDVADFVARYVAVWNEPDTARRAEAIAGLWAENGVEFTATREFRGHEAIAERVAEAHAQFIATGASRAVAGDDIAHHHNAISFSVRLVPAGGGAAFWAADVFAVVGADGRIQHDWQVTGAAAVTRGAVTKFLTRLEAGDPAQIAELFAESVDWKLDWPEEGHPAVPWIRARTTRADVADHFRQLNAFHLADKQGGVGPTVLVDNTEAVILGEIRQTVRATEKPYVASFALRLSVRGGLITRYHVYEDSLTVANAFADTVPIGEE